MSFPTIVHVDGFNSARDRQEAVTLTPPVITGVGDVFTFHPFSFTPPEPQQSIEEIRPNIERGHSGDDIDDASFT